MTEKAEPKLNMLAALAFSTTVLGAVHLLTFVWLTAFVYHDNIRGYVPAGMMGFEVLAVATMLLLIYLGVLGRRKKSTTAYLPLGCLAVPLAVVVASIYCGALLKILGYSVRTDIGISLGGAVLFITLATVIQRKYLRKETANKAMEAIGDPGSPQPHG